MDTGSVRTGDVFSKLAKTLVLLEKGLPASDEEPKWSCAQWDGPKYNGPIVIAERIIYSDYSFERNIFDC